MLHDKLTDDNYFLFCATHYKNARYTSTEDFIEDMNRVKYIKKLITRYIENDDLKERLILNHIIVLNNCFGPVVLCKILQLKLKMQMKYIKPFLVMLDLMQKYIYNVGEDRVINTDLIEMDNEIINRLRKI